MALPFSRDQTVQPGQTVASSLINAIQDAIVTLSVLLFGQPRFPALGGVVTAGTAGTFDTSGTFTTGAADTVFTVGVGARRGHRVTAIGARVTGLVAQTMTMSLHKSTDGVLGGAIATALSVSSGAPQDLVISGQSELVSKAAKGEVYVVQFVVTASPMRVHTVEWEASP